MKHETNNANNFGALRLFFASLVIFSHAPELVDGDRSREVLSRIFGTISFGELAVDGFFLISGYLILKSFQTSVTIKSFLIKRVLRIYPGFIVAFLVCIFVVAPFSGGWQLISHLSFSKFLQIPFNLLILNSPEVDGFYFSNKINALNGSTWTVWLEFLCYLSIPTMFFLGLHDKRRYAYVLGFSATIFLVLLVTGKDYWLPYPLRIGAYHSSRLWTAFLIGGAFYYYRDLIAWNNKLNLPCLILLILLMFSPYTAELAVFTIGAYLLFNFALNYKNKWLNSVGTRHDISYGVYLYAWPIQGLLIQHCPKASPLLQAVATLLIASIAGYLSWIWVEKPFNQLKNRWAVKRP